METKDIVKLWGFPKETIINRNLPKNKIFSFLKNPKDKQFLTDKIQTIYMLANFKTANTNIPVFESEEELYQEVWFYYVKTKENGLGEKIFKFLCSLIPYPIVILLDEEESYSVYTGKFQKLSTSFLKLQNTYRIEFDKLDDIVQFFSYTEFEKLEKDSLKSLYDSFRNIVIIKDSSIKYDENFNYITIEDREKLDLLNMQIDTLRSNILKEAQINRKIDLQMKLKYTTEELLNLKLKIIEKR